MKKITDLDQATTARHEGEMTRAFLGSSAGIRLLGELEKVEQNAYKRAMHGKTPQDQNAYLEARGEVRSVQVVRDLLAEIQAAEQEAIDFIAAANASRNKEV